jgi:hypothetical protein
VLDAGDDFCARPKIEDEIRAFCDALIAAEGRLKL